jgi:uncharacterized protein (DUF169 family)
MDTSKIGIDFKEVLGMKYFPVGLYFSDKEPENTIGFKEPGNGCIMPLIFSSAKGKTAAFNENSMGFDCSAFFLGYKDWIFPGIEYYLSCGSPSDGECERFVKTPQMAKEYLESFKPDKKEKRFAIFKPLEILGDSEKPEVVIFFVNPDQISALVYLLNFDSPMGNDRVTAGFASACGAVATLPLRYARNGEKKAVWGLHDISARARLPKDLMTLAIPFDFLSEVWPEINESFLKTEQWKKIVNRIKNDE